ncbi:MAG: O-antigen ligase family protein [Candidatus Eisenbacteria bacterium]|uniref:O-antigen ligase family protein n=1 Tax=Eiseniibacteriota bacterium TaxID=2212470 RepID=A0A948RW55_UNCEI|nr:O-antigen ligase family protein [Candidatus Eisenbacteria bacterium]
MLCIPLIVTDSTFYPFVFGKAIAFQVLIGLLFVLWLILLARGEVKLRWTLLNVSLLIFFIMMGLATILSVDRIRSFWSTQERMTGFFNMVHYGLFFLMLSTLFSKDLFLWLFRFSLLVSLVMGILALGNFAGRLSGTLGNPGFLAIYMMMHVLFSIFLIIKDRRVLWRICYGMVLVSDLFILIFTKTRAVYMGLVIGAIILLGGLFLKAQLRNRIAGLILLFVFVFGMIGLLWFDEYRSLKPSEARIISWSISWNAFKEKPLLGWGPENYVIPYAKYFPADRLPPESSWFDKAHNIFWEYAVTMGMLGLLAYLTVFIIAGKRALFSAAIIAGYLVAHCFWIETSSCLIPLYLVFAWTDVDKIRD